MVKEFILNLKDNHHNWKKKNMVTLSSSKGSYDEFQCSKCGISGKCYDLIHIVIETKKFSIENIQNCDFENTYANGNPIVLVPIKTKIKITKCTATGKIFGNCIDGSEHITVNAPLPYKNDEKGVWIKGIGEPVKLLNNEFIVIK